MRRRREPNQLSRRGFLEQAQWSFLTPARATQSPPPAVATAADLPWYRRACRWGQTNISEKDPQHYDVEWWRQHWRKTHVQGVIINAGGIVAYYPSRFQLHYRARFLANRDLYGELTRAAHQDGLVVLARMDSNRATEEFRRQHADWFAVDGAGKHYRAGDRYVACLDGPYYEEYLPDLIREIIAHEKPEGFTDNSWTGLDRNQICYCKYSRERFRRATGKELPAKKDWDDPVYREWIEWSYRRRIEIWDLNNRVTRQAGGPDCLWLGMIGGDFIGQGQRFRDVKAICERAEIIMLDDQGRSVSIGFNGNAEIGKRLHGLLGWDKLIPESMATYQRAPVFRKAAASKPEARMWMYAGFAGGIQPWWHHVGAFQWDRRQFAIEIPVFHWHAENEPFLLQREPVATVGLVYSQRNADFYGRDDAQERVGRPYYGFLHALTRARIPYTPVHADHIAQAAGKLAVLILPNLAAMSEEQVVAVRRFVEAGGALVATGETSLYDRWGEPHANFALADLFGAEFAGKRHGSVGAADTWGEQVRSHSYLRLLPDAGRDLYGPKAGHEPVISPKRHPVLQGFEATDILPFGGLLLDVKAAADRVVPATFVPSFPTYPPEMSWMEVERTDIPCLILSDPARTGRRVAYLPADLERRYARDYLPDHGRLLANVVRWAAAGRLPLQVKGAGLIDCHLYRQPGRLILHVLNLVSDGTWRSPVHELVPVGPFEIQVRLDAGVGGNAVRFLVASKTASTARQGGWCSFTLPRVLDHEVVVIE